MENLFLTDTRRAVLDSSADWEDGSIAVEKTRIRKRARLAIEELTAVAASPEIDNSDVFEPDELARLVATIISPPGKEITPRWNFDDDPAEYRETYDYPISVTWRLDHIIDGYADTLLRTHPPGDVVEDTDIDLISDE